MSSAPPNSFASGSRQRSMKLYDFAFSPNCRKVRAVAYELGTALDDVSVHLVRGESHLAQTFGLPATWDARR